jgi:serine/threonine protein kinase
MENCGTDLANYFYKISNNNLNNLLNNNLQKLLNIFKDCCEAVKIIHDLGYLHLDIKPNNFMIKDNQIKIIDFGESQKVGYKTTDLIGTEYYIANDWMKNYLSEPKI